MKKLIATFIIAAGVLGMTTQLSARQGPGGDHMDPLDHIERLAEHLELSAEQEQQITDIVNATQIANAVDKERLDQVRDELRDLSEAFDDATAQGLADVRQLQAHLAGGRRLVIFPEGEIYHCNERVTPFREGAAAIAVAAYITTAQQQVPASGTATRWVILVTDMAQVTP